MYNKIECKIYLRLNFTYPTPGWTATLFGIVTLTTRSLLSLNVLPFTSTTLIVLLRESVKYRSFEIQSRARPVTLVALVAKTVCLPTK